MMNKRLKEAVLAALDALPEGEVKATLNRELRRTQWGFVYEELMHAYLPPVAYGKPSISTIAKWVGVPTSKLHDLHRTGKLRYELYDGGRVYDMDVLHPYILKTKEL